MMPVVTAAEMRALDRATIEDVGLPALTLMETAGRAVAEAALRMLGPRRGHVMVVCGPGNNGGDGFVAARMLRDHGADAVVYLAIARAAVRGDARTHLEIFERAGGVVRMIAEPEELRVLEPALALAGGVAPAPMPVPTPGPSLGAQVTTPMPGQVPTPVPGQVPTPVPGQVPTVMAIQVPTPGKAALVPAMVATKLTTMVAAQRPGLVPSLVPALVIDALFGVGLARPIVGHLADVVTMMGKAGRILAVDIPSGLDTDTGTELGAAVTAERTVTMAALKIALVSAPGFARSGEVEVADIGIPRGLIDAARVRASLVEPSDVGRWLPHPHALEHKGRRGHVLVVGGSPGMRGAGRLAAVAALRAGAGLCTLAADGELDAPDPVMTRTLAPGGALGSFLVGKAAVVIGPGIGASPVSAARANEVLASGLPAVLDADSLNVLASDPGAIADAAGPVVLTPHPGEASRLLGITVGEIEADRLGAARALAAKTRSVVVLKGARTIVCDGARSDAGGLHCWINPTGGPALATGGSGDVLAGTIGALLAQGLSAVDAARAGVFVHGVAGDQLAALHGTRGVISSDLPGAIALAIVALSRNR